MSTFFISKTHLDENGDLKVQKFEPNSDAFNRIRTSAPMTQFDYQNQYNAGDIIWSSKVAGTGAYTHQPNSSTVLLSTGGTASGAYVYRQTRQYLRYTSGKSLLVIATTNFKNPVLNVRKRCGYFDNLNGIFLQEVNGQVSIVLRSTSSGITVDKVIPQNQWSHDKMDGYGPSGLVADFTKCQIFLTDIQWLGVGTVRCGLEIGGKDYYFHHFDNANLVDTTYMTTANLPVRYEIENIGTAASVGTMLQICSTVITEDGGVDSAGYYTHSASTKTTPKAITTRACVLSIRPKALLNGIVNRARVIVLDIDVRATTNDCYWELVYNGAIGGTPSWTSVSDNSPVEFDIAGTTMTGGEVIHSGFGPSGSGANSSLISETITAQYPLALDIDGLNPASFTLVATSFSGTSNVSATMNFREFY